MYIVRELTLDAACSSFADKACHVSGIVRALHGASARKHSSNIFHVHCVA